MTSTATELDSNSDIGLIIAAAILFCVWVIGYAPAVELITTPWLEGQGFHSHGILVTGLVGYLIYRDRRYLFQSDKGSLLLRSAALTASVVCAAAWFASWAASIQVGQILAACLTLFFALAYLFGWYQMRGWTRLFLLMSLTLPIWWFATPLLSEFASQIVGSIVKTTGLTVYIQGNFISIPQGTFVVENGCSGLGFILVALSLTGFYCLLDNTASRFTLGFLLASLIIGLVANWIRIYLIILVGYFFGMDNPLVTDHILFGWIVFALIFTPYLLFLSNRIEQASVSKRVLIGIQRRSSPPWSRMLGMLGCLIIFPVWALTIQSGQKDSAPENWPVAGQAYTEKSHSVDWNPHFANAAYSKKTVYQPNSDSNKQSHVILYSAYYAHQTANAEVINYANSITGEGWQQSKNAPVVVDMQQKRIVVKESELSRGLGLQQRMLVRYWYVVAGLTAYNTATAKYYQVLGKLAGRGDAWVHAVAAPCLSENCQAAKATLTRFMTQLEIENS